MSRFGTVMRSTWFVVVLAAWRAVPTGAQVPNTASAWGAFLPAPNATCGPGSYGSGGFTAVNSTGLVCNAWPSREMYQCGFHPNNWWEGRMSVDACMACLFDQKMRYGNTYHGINYQPPPPGQGWHSARCYLCPSGYKSSHIYDCQECPAGTASNATDATTSAACQACPAGKKSTIKTGATNCTQCGPGHYQASSGQSTCTPCAAGRASSAIAATSSSVCTACPAGRGAAPGSTHCTECGPGRTWSNSSWSLQAAGACHNWHTPHPNENFRPSPNCWGLSDEACSTTDRCGALCNPYANQSIAAITWGPQGTRNGKPAYNCGCCGPGYKTDLHGHGTHVYKPGGCAGCPKGTYKAVNHGTCQPCATGTSARRGSTSCFPAATTTQEITFAIAASHWTGLVKSLAESAYALSLNIWDVTNKVVLPDYIVNSRAVAASHRSNSSTVTFTTIMPTTAESTVKAVVAVVTANTMNTNQNMIKLFADAGTYGSVQPPTVTSVVNTGGPAPTMTPTTSRAVQLTCSMPYAFAADCLVSSSKQL